MLLKSLTHKYIDLPAIFKILWKSFEMPDEIEVLCFTDLFLPVILNPFIESH